MSLPYDEFVNAQSSNEEILAAISKAAKLPRNTKRKRTDYPKPDDPNQHSWIVAGDIGFSRRDDTSLLKRLREMAKQGVLEERLPSIGQPRFRPVLG